MHSFWGKKEIQYFILCFFIVFLGVETLLIFFPPIFYQEWLAQMVGHTLHVPVQGVFLLVQGVRFEISAFCAGFTTWALLAGLLFGFSYPPLRQKVYYSILGFGIISILNFFRILFIVQVGKDSPFLVEPLHILTWFVLSVLVFGMWYYLLSLHARSTSSKKIAALLLHGKRKN